MKMKKLFLTIVVAVLLIVAATTNVNAATAVSNAKAEVESTVTVTVDFGSAENADGKYQNQKGQRRPLLGPGHNVFDAQLSLPGGAGQGGGKGGAGHVVVHTDTPFRKQCVQWCPR